MLISIDTYHSLCMNMSQTEAPVRLVAKTCGSGEKDERDSRDDYKNFISG
jgi:hypothetical protein